jgi:predicted N-acetyltransferase YhbS
MQDESEQEVVLIESMPSELLSPEEIEAILATRHLVWPEAGMTLHSYLEKRKIRPQQQVYLIREEGHVVAHAETFERILLSEERSLMVGCLSSVFVAPDRQQHGLGRKLMQRVFDDTRRSEWVALLWQTTVPDFYLRLGAVLVQNHFINRSSSTPEANPWEEEHVMIYPNRGVWPQGIIDLNGRAF